MNERSSELAIPAVRQETSHSWYVLGMLLVVCALSFADRYLLAGLVEPIKQDLGVSDTYIGFLLGPAFAILYTTAAIPIARLADRASRVMILAVGCATWSLFTLLSGHVTDPLGFALMRVGVGLGEAAFSAPAYSLLSDYFPPRRRALAFAVLGVGYFLGQVGGLSLGPLIAAEHGWRQAFVAAGLPGFVVALLLCLTVREPPRAHLQIRGKIQEPLWATLRSLWRLPSYRLMTAGAALGGFATFSFGMWGATYFARVHGLPLANATLTFALGYGLSSLLGMLASGWLSDRLARRSASAPMRLAAGSLLALIVCILLACAIPDLSSAVFFLVAGGLLGGGYSANILAALQDLLPDAIRATATAVFAFLVTFVGMVGGPYTAGVLSDVFSSFGADALRYALIATSFVGVLAALLLLRSIPTLAADARALAAGGGGTVAVFDPHGQR